jgi:hypothetical protein
MSAIPPAIEMAKERINQTMKWYFPSIDYTYYNDAPTIKQIVLNQIDSMTNVYIPFYTREILEDRYPTPDDGFTFEIASDMSDSIKWIGQNKNLLVGTETAEWVIPSGVNATNVQAVLNSRYGSDNIQGTTVGDAFCFFQTGRKALVEYYIPQQDNNFRANNMAMLSPNMLHKSAAVDFDFISAPYTKIFVCREDGAVACLLYERSTGTFAWGLVAMDGGEIKSVATLPGPEGYDEAYFIVKRGGDYFLERLDERGRCYLDSNDLWTGDAAGYASEAVILDETDGRTYPLNGAEIPSAPGDHTMYIGYPFTSRVRSMPVLANDKMKQNNIKNLSIRFLDSHMPRMGSFHGSGREAVGWDSINSPSQPFSGVVRAPFPGVWDRDVFFEFVHAKPTPCRILAVNAEVN